MRHQNWKCPKCACEEFDTGEFRATGGRLAKIFDVQNRKFTTVFCTRCKFTEIYSTDSSKLMNVFDFFTG